MSKDQGNKEHTYILYYVLISELGSSSHNYDNKHLEVPHIQVLMVHIRACE